DLRTEIVRPLLGKAFFAERSQCRNQQMRGARQRQTRCENAIAALARPQGSQGGGPPSSTQLHDPTLAPLRCDGSGGGFDCRGWSGGRRLTSATGKMASTTVVSRSEANTPACRVAR